MSTLVSVLLSTTGAYAGVRYAFRRPKSFSAADGTVLDHLVMDGASTVTNLIMGSQNPKPSRAKKKRATGYASSFISASAITAAGNAGWQIEATKRDGGRARITQFTIVVYVTLNGIKYAWNIRKTLYNKIKGSLGALGVKVAAAGDDLVFGANFPRPPQVIINTAQGADVLSTSSFFDPSNESALAGNFSVKVGRYTQSQWGAVAR